ncbi:MAG: TRAP transporter large permease subunit [Deltaproteobacteria bacterium]|nr:TRAP transporter large permease subunit [Deltaproteobacteria bacterium]MBW1924893.1 TRAP transporter large permease subunit [Deltaproteobacteria bacterium]MBW1951134.1 TRAP transporter large permease subunit [Deltaproteobacteria bacterium]MBW2009680.1 TRAP transporter large permease subunit [Deltaproteobacteria bacterium]
MELWLLTVCFFATLIILLLLGLPIAFSLGGVAILYSYLLWGPKSLLVIPSAVHADGSNFILAAVPLFVLMGNMLEVSGLADDLYEMMYRWFQRIPGGLASGTVLICTVFAAMAGISGVATVTMGLIAIPSMLKRGYHKDLAIGTVSAGGALGILIPPSVIAILYGSITGASVGKLFIGGMLPGLILACIFIFYITLRCIIQPHLAPPPSEAERFSWREKLISLKGLVLPILLISAVLGVIYTGVCTPTEASAIGAAGSLLCCAIRGRLTWANLRTATLRTFNVTCMCIWIVIGAKCFTSIYIGCGASQFMMNLVHGLDISPLAFVAIMEFIYIILGMLMDPAGMVMITAPVFVPVIISLGFDPVWFGVLFIINAEMAYITPPFGFNLFYMKAIVPEGVRMADVYRSVIPFVFCQLFCLILVMFYPQLALWLPGTMKW